MPEIFLTPIDPVLPVYMGEVGLGPINVMNYLGDGWVPKDIRRRRMFNLETMRRLGSPMIIKHMFNDRDVKEGRARKADSFNSVYGQVRHDEELSYGVGFVGLETSPNEYFNPNTGVVQASDTAPGNPWIPAPYHRGFGPGYLTWVIEPDVAEDIFKQTLAGVLIKAQTATAQAPWFPEMNDNDLLVNVVLDRAGRITATRERYQLKMTNPITMRGHQRRGRREFTEDGGNRFLIGQQFEMTLIPQTDVLYHVPVDR